MRARPIESVTRRRAFHDAGVWLRGGVAIAADVFAGTVNIVNGMHRAIGKTTNRLNPSPLSATALSDFVYDRVRDIGQLSFLGARELADLSGTLLPARAADIPERVSLGLRSALNGAFGDYLEASGNELALSMELVDDTGRALAVTPEGLAGALHEPSPRVVLLVHGLGMNDQQWRQGGRADFGERIAAEFGYTALRLRYNSGRHISENGRELADLLECLVAAYPVTIERLTIIGHSMGGLVARSAGHHAESAGHRWVDRLADLVCLGSPHLGAPLERLGNHVTTSLKRIPHTEPLAVLGNIRSAGVKDLRFGYLRDEDWQKDGADARDHTPPRALVGLDHVDHFLVAATLGQREGAPLGRWLGDLVVPVESAVGLARSPSRRLAARDQDGRVFYGMTHFALIHHDDVYAAIADWLGSRLRGKSPRRR